MSHPSPLVWFRFHGGDLGLASWLSFRVHCMRCSTCGERLRTELEERAAFEGAGAPAAAPEQAASAGLVLRIAFPILAIAVCMLVLVLLPKNDGPRGDLAMNDDAASGSPDMLRAKGSGSFDVLVVRTDDERALGPRCAEGDTLQARYASTRRQLMVVGVDPLGAARVLFPLDGEASQALTPGASLVPNSWVLDAQPGRERFVAFFTDEPLRAEDARRAALADRPQLAGASIVVRECVKAAR